MVGFPTGICYGIDYSWINMFFCTLILLWFVSEKCEEHGEAEKRTYMIEFPPFIQVNVKR